ncbi:helix-turn-helix transcriptional regulator [Slackia sp.]
MSVAQARGIVKGLKWHHLGFCFFWAVTFVALLAPADEFAFVSTGFSVGKQISTIAAVVVAATLSVRRGSKAFSPESAYIAGIALSAGSLLYYLAFFLADFSVASVTIASVLVGASQGAFFVMWQSFYASEGTSRTTVYIPLSALCSVVLCIAIGFLPTEWLVVCGVIVLPALGAWTLRKSLAEVAPYEAEALTRERRRMLLRDMGRPVFCVCAIGFVWKMIGYVVPQGNLGSFEGIMLGMSCATLVVAAIELFTERGFDMLRVYQVLFPLITGVFLLPTFFGIGWLGAVSVFTMFGFEVVNLLLLITCAAYASRKAIDSSLVYALCVAPTLVSLLLGDTVGQVAAAHTVLDFTLVVDVLFVCVYVLTAALFLASLGRNRSDVRRSITAAPQASVGECDFGEALAKNAARAKSEESLVQDACAAEEEPCVQKALSSEGESRDAQWCEEKPSPALHRSNDADPMAPTGESSDSLEERLSSLNLIDPLSARECEVADLMRHGNTVAAIARRLYISENTVRGHTKSIYRKLGIHSKQELIDLLN